MIKILGLLKLLRTRLGILILVTVAAMIFVFLTKKPQIEKKSGQTREPNESKTAQVYFSIPEGQKEQPITTINRNTASIKTTIAPQPKVVREPIIQSNNETKIVKGISIAAIDKHIPIILDIYNKVMKAPPEEEIVPVIKTIPKQPIPPQFAPFGRMIKCELINTVDSGNLETPIIGLVMESVYWNGDLIVPVGSEIHGIATTDKLRERIVSGKKWNIILPSDGNRPNGAALKIDGVALDREDPSGEGKSYGITDGSFGLKGHRIKSNNLEEIKIFAATFLGAIASGLQTQEPSGSIFGGTKPANTFKDASLGGITAIMNRLAEKIEKEIEENGFYTRVPAGKQFYLYVQQTINPENWDMAGSLKEEKLSIEDTDAWMDKITLLKEKLTENEK